MTALHFESKGVQTDKYSQSKLLKKLQKYITVVSQYRLHLFNQYIQSDEYYEYEDLRNVRKEILNRFEWVIIELEQIIEGLHVHQLSSIDVQQSIDRPVVKDVIETSLSADLPSIDKPNVDEWKMYRRDLQETKEDFHILDLLVHRGISKLDRLVNVTNLYT